MTSILFSCSKDDLSQKKIPDKFDIKIEIKGSGDSQKAYLFINSFSIKQWDYIDFPFEDSYAYYTKGDEINNSSCKCIKITAGAYISTIDKIDSFNLYVNGKLVDSTKQIALNNPDGTMNLTKLEFIFYP